MELVSGRCVASTLARSRPWRIWLWVDPCIFHRRETASRMRKCKVGPASCAVRRAALATRCRYITLLRLRLDERVRLCSCSAAAARHPLSPAGCAGAYPMTDVCEGGLGHTGPGTPSAPCLQDAIDRDQKDVFMKTSRNSAAALPFAPIRAADATRSTFRHLACAVGLALCCTAGSAQTNGDIGGPAAVIPLSDEAPPRLVVYPPLAEPLARGVVIVQYRTENMRIIPSSAMARSVCHHG